MFFPFNIPPASPKWTNRLRALQDGVTPRRIRAFRPSWKRRWADLGFLDLFGNPTATNAPSWDPNGRVFEDTWDPDGRERCDSPSHFPSHFMAIFSYPLPMSNSIWLRQSCATWTWGWASPSSAPRLQWCNLLEVQTLIVWLMTMMKESNMCHNITERERENIVVTFFGRCNQKLNQDLNTCACVQKPIGRVNKHLKWHYGCPDMSL